MESPNDEQVQRILRVLVAIQEGLDDDLTTEDLAQRAAFSRFHFQRVFRAVVGESVAEHLRRLRLERAAHRLRAGAGDSILDLALEAKYDSHEAFTRAFRQAFGVPPSEFRDDASRFTRIGSASRIHFQTGGPPPTRADLSDRTHLLEGRITTFEAIRVAFVRHVGPYEQAAGAFRRLEAWAGERGIPANTQRIGVPRDNPNVTPPERLRFDACVVVDEAVVGEADIGIQELAGGEYASTHHVGPFATLVESYAWLAAEWLPTQRRVMAAAPCLELYGAPITEAPSADHVTELRVPVAQR